jgi:hypothetical protein
MTSATTIQSVSMELLDQPGRTAEVRATGCCCCYIAMLWQGVLMCACICMVVELLDQPGSTAEVSQTSPLLLLLVLLLLLLLLLLLWHAVARHVHVYLPFNDCETCGPSRPHRSGKWSWQQSVPCGAAFSAGLA